MTSDVIDATTFNEDRTAVLQRALVLNTILEH
jgi:hypothetical protein